jgi:hypothetical protein
MYNSIGRAIGDPVFLFTPRWLSKHKFFLVFNIVCSKIISEYIRLVFILWTTILTSTGQGNYTTDTFNGLSVQTRYVKVQATGSHGTSGISLFEFEIYGN